MNFYFPNNVLLSINDLPAGKINQNFSAWENYILNYVQNWIGGSDQFKFKTSGSTGAPKEIHLTRDQLTYSAISTLDFLYPKTRPEKLLLCINPTFIGGTQVITRTLLSKANLIFQEPTSNPLRELNSPVDLASMVPFQMETILNEDPKLFDKVGTVLIGGAALSSSAIEQLKRLKTRFFQTYGMTETASNIALKEITEDTYSFIGDIEYKVDNRGCLAVKGTVTSREWIQTNDVVEFKGNGFKVLGRADWVINSGGIKIHPEVVERKIASHLSTTDVFVTHVPDEKLGEKVVLCTKVSIIERLKSADFLSKYEQPKSEFILNEFPLTSSGKTDRKALQNLAQERLG